MFDWYIRKVPIKHKLALAFGTIGVVAVGVTAAVWWREITIASTLQDPAHRQALDTLANLSLVALAIEVAIIAALAVTFISCIGTPYVTTVLRMEALARGDLDSPVLFTDYQDCVGRITRAMQTFRDAAVERAALHAAAAGHQVELDGRLRATETAFEARGRDQKAVVDALARALAALSSGDLATRIEGEVAPDYRKLRDDFDGAVAALQDAMTAVATHVGSMGNGVVEIAQAADELSRRTERQATSLEETAAAIDEVSATVRHTADSAGRARGVVAEARGAAERSSAVMQEAVAAMNRIQTSSREIGQIISVVDEIAFQTNLLALNAGVEAARAGEAGRGFAVVASEVRALAQRSADAAREIKGLISTSTSEVMSGVDLVTRTGDMLGRIASQVGSIDVLVGEIAASAAQQASALGEVNASVNEMDQVTQQNAAMVEQSTAGSHRLAGEAAELTRLIGAFRGLGQTSAPERAPASRPAPVPARPAKPSRARAVLAAVRGGGAARKLEAAVSGDWAEF
ncbi:methyl-accepting chemotaxis protein [Lichenibacterium ramalinae]|uniref:Methyl-accepting chemotaxis protein n=1 Tax=Lichenibacterium ramalinae TaxID=2316527 RepID=A0A4Q2RG65_9HYPH|nr:methyl-accepting chemotaxis protein [Lichenibacterium ramalinae]RYB06395.1 methyl-accepting chemotaxis protein [Lichenibacterium ramalinae]